ncbi:MAG: Gfo/Idh/MocA family oxidoreductase, partial [Planctomycetota bacterium]
MNRPVGVGVIGMGFMGRTHALNAAHLARDEETCTLAAVCSNGLRTIDDLLDTKSSGNLGAHGAWPETSRPAIAPDARSLFDNPDVDLVVIATPTPTHVPFAREALQSGKHVLVEKPVALTARELGPLVDA